MTQTHGTIWTLIADIRNCQVIAQSAIRKIAQKKYTEAQAIIIIGRELERIGGILREFEKNISEQQPKPKEIDIWRDI